MNKHAIIIDSTVYLPKETILEEQLEVVSLNVLEGSNTYRELDIDNAFVFDTLNQGKHLSTSQPSPNEFLETYQKLVDKGSEFIFVLCLSKGVSGTYQSAILAKNMFDKPEMIHVFDTENAAFGNELLALELIALRKKNISKETIIKTIETNIQNAHLYFTVENLYSLQKGGRLSKTQAIIGTLLKVKPVIKMIEGKLKLVNKERTFGKLYDYLLGEIKKDEKEGKTLYVRLIQINSLENLQVMKQRIESMFSKVVLSITDYIGPVFSIHIGDKGFGVTWYFA